MKLVLMDVDGTLFEGPSTESSFIRFLMRRRLLGVRQYLAAGLFYPRWFWKFGRHTARKNKAYLYRLDVSAIESLASRFVHEILQARLRREIFDRIRQHHGQGDRVVLITGTPEFLARPIAELVSADGYRCTQLVMADRRFGASPPIRHPLGEEKIQSALEACREYGVHLENCIAYGDSRFDIPLFNRVANPIAVYPDSELHVYAACRGWPVISNPQPPALSTKADLFDNQHLP